MLNLLIFGKYVEKCKLSRKRSSAMSPDSGHTNPLLLLTRFSSRISNSFLYLIVKHATSILTASIARAGVLAVLLLLYCSYCTCSPPAFMPPTKTRSRRRICPCLQCPHHLIKTTAWTTILHSPTKARSTELNM